MSEPALAKEERGNALTDMLKRHPWWVLMSCFGMLFGLGWLDYVTGYELSFFVFYSAPIGFAAWYSGRIPAIIVALGATVAWLLADYFGGVKYSTNLLYYWNSIVHFGAFIINAITIARIKIDIDHRHELAQELKSAHARLSELSKQSESCPSCGHPFVKKSMADTTPPVAVSK